MSQNFNPLDRGPWMICNDKKRLRDTFNQDLPKNQNWMDACFPIAKDLDLANLCLWKGHFMAKCKHFKWEFYRFIILKKTPPLNSGAVPAFYQSWAVGFQGTKIHLLNEWTVKLGVFIDENVFQGFDFIINEDSFFFKLRD